MLISPVASTYATRVPYVTPGEFRRHPTGVDTKNLVPGQSAAVNEQALRDVLLRASSYADDIVEKLLGATVDSQAGDYTPGPGGVIKVPLDNSPIVAVADVELGLAPGSLVSIGTDGCSLDGRILTIPVGYGQWGPTRVYARVTYINGWANAQLTQAAPPGSTSITLNNALGVVPGMTLALTGDSRNESVTVAPGFVPSTSLDPVTVPLASPVAGGSGGGYVVGDVASAMPQNIKLAVILLACAIIKTRGSSAVVMGSIASGPAQAVPFQDGAEGEYGMAVDLLNPYRRTI
ncbi:head-to-tail adaptor [Arthrobacter phage Sonali]|uniref:Head-to-tail adaptor n=1 Tax=Arthrobacter phage Sonali TaxID=2510495 RepID=A0A411CQL1_9CAUD|nr:head-to-tail adaptor [Arthrobacter phage Sonali]QAY16122.1 head-to-tail adaptor [Arthrobacter phage Sonali]